MQQDIFAMRDGCSGKTSQGHFQATGEQTLLQWLEKWLGPELAYRGTDGRTPELLSDHSDSSSGLAWTLNFSESRNAAEECLLSSILETGKVEDRYFLSAKACAGILRRAEKRGKKLPEPLSLALRAVADSAPISSVQGD